MYNLYNKHILKWYTQKTCNLSMPYNQCKKSNSDIRPLLFCLIKAAINSVIPSNFKSVIESRSCIYVAEKNAI